MIYGKKQMTFNDYDGFTEKFKPKKTTDDCYTPEPVYNAVLEFVKKEYGIEGREIVRPFYPGGDYEMFDYPDNCVVIDNPPFSIVSKIAKFYVENKIDFFLFAPTLTNFSIRAKCCHVITDCSVTYHNGAVINTSFITSLIDAISMTEPKLAEAIANAQISPDKKELPKYTYPDNILTVSDMNKISSGGIKVKFKHGVTIGALDAQKKIGKGIFGRGILISDKDAEMKKAEMKKAEMKKAEMKKEQYTFILSDSERQIVEHLNELEDK
jgi:hypothetical protein